MAIGVGVSRTVLAQAIISMASTLEYLRKALWSSAPSAYDSSS